MDGKSRWLYNSGLIYLFAPNLAGQRLFLFQKRTGMKRLFSARAILFFKTCLMALVVGSSAKFSFAKEGMWLPANLKSRAADMRAEGLEIPIDQLYNSDGTGLNNAIVLFGRGCTGEIISSQGLVLTNHHCGYGSVQRLSSRTNDYFAAGFWAMNLSQELPCPGLTVTFVRKMENVTSRITYDLADTLAPSIRDSIVNVRVRALEKGYKYSTGLDAQIKPYYNGNQYWVALTETYRDIRLVGFPPNGIGSFGGDSDNWMWPRQTGDFSLFRVYAGKDGKPADYSKDNKPYRPKQFFQINVSGYKEGDFAMVYGFPAYTHEYIANDQLQIITKIQDPIRIELRTRKLKVWDEAMHADREIFLKYTSKKAGLANGWKKWQGELRGLRLNKVSDKKAAYEFGFQAWANSDSSLPYARNLLPQIQVTVAAAEKAIQAEEYIREAVLGVELLSRGAAMEKLMQAFRSGKQEDLEKDLADWKGFFKNYDAATDEKVFVALMPAFIKEAPDYVPSHFLFGLRANNGDYRSWARHVFGTSAFTSQQGLEALVAAHDANRILADPAWQLYHAIMEVYRQRVLPQLSEYSTRIAPLNRLYMAAQMAKDSNEYSFYPDANFTLRLSYGHITGIDPDGPAGYSYQTNLDQVIAKDQPDVEEFRVPEKLKELYAKKDYGRWAIPAPTPENPKWETVPVAFLSDNHTSGGNSGSPVLNAKGQLIGTNFDRVWEGTMSDLYFDEKLCRNISVDIRYTLFIIEKFGGAGWLLKEMRLVR